MYEFHRNVATTATVFVFGSNLAGRHGKGAAVDAVKRFGAIRGVGVGFAGNSYAIPTKDENIRTISLSRIRPHVAEFVDYAKNHPESTFFVTRIGCGLAGYSDQDIAPMFVGSPKNCQFPIEWAPFLKA